MYKKPLFLIQIHEPNILASQLVGINKQINYK